MTVGVDEDSAPSVRVEKTEQGTRIVLMGQWNLRGLLGRDRLLRRQLVKIGPAHSQEWDLREVAALDSAGSMFLWSRWQEQWPPHLLLKEDQKPLFERVSRIEQPASVETSFKLRVAIEKLGFSVLRYLAHLRDLIQLAGQMILDIIYVLLHPTEIPWREISATMHKAGNRALGITALVGVLIGIVLSYLSSEQLRLLGADQFIVNLLGFGVTRELGPILAAILVAGRSGSAMTAELGIMRVTEELDAIQVMGISLSRRLILPKILGLAIALPLLTVWTNAMAILGGMLIAKRELDMGFGQFLSLIPDAIPVGSYLLGMLKAVVFGMVIAIVACHFGLRVQPNTESLGKETTNAVVMAITMVMITDAAFAVLFRNVGIYD
jgi:phospholipid/cholesterol/gamma-HCH transport system permease protein